MVIMQPINKEPTLLKANVLNEDDIGTFKWNSSHNSDYLTVSNDGQTIEWKVTKGIFKRYFLKKYKPCWVPASTFSQLHSGHYYWDFVVEEMACAQIGIGFMLQWDIGPDWGVLGYLGSSTSAWSYDPSTGDIVCATKSIQGGLPKFENGHKGIISVELNLPRESDGMAKFIVNEIVTPSFELPRSSVVLPAACFLKESQKITLASFRRL